MAMTARAAHALHDLHASLPRLRRTQPQSHGQCTSHHARDACSRPERGRAFDRRSRAHIDELKHLLLHVPRDGESDGGHLQEQPFLTRTRPHAATASMCSQHTVSVCRIGYVRSFRRPKHALPRAARLSKACERRTKGVAFQRSSPRSAKASRSSCRASGAQRAWMIPSAKRGFS